MRIGQNPSKIKGLPAYTPKRVGVASLTFVPSFEGYFRQARHVIETHLASLRASLDEPCDLLVFDNGSCPEMIAFLKGLWESGQIDSLFLSRHNIGKNGALNWIFSGMPNEFIAYADSDVFYRPGWLQRSLEVFENFEKAGMVSAQPVFFDFLKGQGATAAQIAAYGSGLQIGSFKPRPELVAEYCDGINAAPELRADFHAQELPSASAPGGLRVVTRATDMQFMMRRSVAAKVVPFPIAGALTGRDAIEVPLRIEAAGYWILSSDEPLVWHMGNNLEGRSLPEVDALRMVGAGSPRPPSSDTNGSRQNSGLRGWLRQTIKGSPTLRKVADRLYGGLFRILYEE
jgi:hypothetical protein